MSTPNHRDIRSHRAIRRYLPSLLILMVWMAPIVASASARPFDPADLEGVNASTIWLDGPIQATPAGTISYNITSDATRLFGTQLELHFDPAVLQVVGTQVTPGNCPEPGYVVTNDVDNYAGIVSYAVTALSPTVPCDGGIIASFQFRVSLAAAEGTTQVQFFNVILADSDGEEIPVTVVDLNLEIGKRSQHWLSLPIILR